MSEVECMHLNESNLKSGRVFPIEKKPTKESTSEKPSKVSAAVGRGVHTDKYVVFYCVQTS